MKDLRFVLVVLLLAFFVFGIAVNRTGEGIKTRATQKEAGEVIVDYTDALANKTIEYLGGEAEESDVNLENIGHDTAEAFKTMNEQKEVVQAKKTIWNTVKKVGYNLWEAIKMTVDNFLEVSRD